MGMTYRKAFTVATYMYIKEWQSLASFDEATQNWCVTGDIQQEACFDKQALSGWQRNCFDVTTNDHFVLYQNIYC